jgi:iron(III) transport system ATP-binding protein
MANIKLKLENIHKLFGNVRAVGGFSHSIMEGQCVVLLGPSGCGKTTILRLIGGFLRPDEGTISMDGQEISSKLRCIPPDKRNMSMVFQSYALWPNRTVFENVAYGLKLRKVSSAQIRSMVSEVLELVGMHGLEKRYPPELSGGQQQRVALARALVVKPDILLLDEPLSNLDAKLRVRMRDEIKDIHRKSHITFVYVTHDQDEAMVMADCIILMNEGKVMQVGTPEELYKRPQNVFAANFIGTSNQFIVRVENIDHEKRIVSFSTDFGERIYAAPGSHMMNDLFPGRKMIICMRPESILLSRDGGPERINSFKGRIQKRKYYGSMIEYEIDAGHRSIIGQTGPSGDFVVGNEIFVHIPPEDCILVED